MSRFLIPGSLNYPLPCCALSQALKEYFPSIMAISESLLRSMDSAVVAFAQSLYEHAFQKFALFHQQVGCFNFFFSTPVARLAHSLGTLSKYSAA